MKQKSLLKTMLLLCALIVGSNAWADTVTDELTQSWTGVSGTNYTNWSNKSANSEAVYAGNSAGGNNSIQLRSNNSNSGIVTTTSGGKVKKITVTWNSETSNGRTLNVYGKNSAYSAATDLYSSNTQGTLLGTIVKGTSTELNITDDYEYIGFRSASGAMYLTEVDIVWETGGGDTPSISADDVEIAYNATNGEIEYTINNGVEGGALTSAIVTVSTPSNWLTVSNTLTSPIELTCSANSTASERTATVALTYTYNTSETVSKNVTVTQAAVPPMVTINTPTGGTLVVKNGDATVASGDRIPVGTVLTIEATPDETYKYHNWQYKKGTGSWVTKTTNFTYTMDENDVEFRANFDQTYAVNWSVNGTVTLSPTRYAGGETITLADAPANIDGRIFVGWAAETINGRTDEAPTFLTTPVMGTSDVTYYAVFASKEIINENISATFTAADISNLTANGNNQWTHNETGIVLKGDGKDSDSFYANAGTSNYLELSVNGSFKSINVTLFSSTFQIGSVSVGTLSTNGAYQTITFDSDVSSVRLYSTSSYKIYADVIVVNADLFDYTDYCTTVAPLYAVNVSDVTNGSITVKKGNNDVAGKSVYAAETLTLTATPSTGYKLRNWTATAGTITDATAAITTFTMPAEAVTIGAVFEKDSYDLILEAVDDHGTFTVTVDGETWDGSSKILYDSEVSITANANSNYAFASWNTMLDNYDATTNPLVFNMPANDVMVQASFYDTTIEYDILIFEEHPTGGTISASLATATLGTEVTLTATPEDDTYLFVGWEVIDDDNNPVTVTNDKFLMPASDVLVSGTFKKIHTVTYYVAGEETVVNRLDGDELNIDDPAAQNGMAFAGWSTTNNAVSPNFLTNTTVTSDLTLYAIFVEQEGAIYYEKVSSISEGDYLIVYETGGVALDGGRSTSLGNNNIFVSVSISNNRINEPTDAINAARFHIAPVDGGYSICTMDGTYIGRTGNSNGLDKSKETVYVNTIEFNSGDAVIKSATQANAKLQCWWQSSSQACIKYYTSSQNAIQLYKKLSDTPTYTLALPVNVTIPESGYLSFCYDSKLDFSETDVKAYKASVNTETGKVTLTQVDVVPANEGVVLHCATAGTYSIPVTTADASDVTDNEMVGVLARTQVLWNPSTGVYNYILQQGEFNKANDGYLKANRAYLSTSYDISASGARSLKIVFDGEATGIAENEIMRNVENEKVYNLNGQRVDNPKKGGLYIVNGKKVFKK